MANEANYLMEFSEYALKSEAEKAAKSLVIRTYDNGSSTDTRYTSSPEEANILENCIYGALLTVRQYGKDSLPSAANTAELIADHIIGDLNGYCSIYIPINQIIDDMETAALRARETKSEYYYNGYNIDRTAGEGGDWSATWWIHRNGKTIAYSDGSIDNVRLSIKELYVSGDDLRAEDAAAAEREAEKGNNGFDDDIEQETMTTLLNTFPETVYSHDHNNNCIIVRWGESGHYKTDYPEGGYTDEVVDELNADRGIIPEQRKAMEFCAMAAQSNPSLDWEKTYKLILKRSIESKYQEPLIDQFASDDRK